MRTEETRSGSEVALVDVLLEISTDQRIFESTGHAIAVRTRVVEIADYYI